MSSHGLNRICLKSDLRSDLGSVLLRQMGNLQRHHVYFNNKSIILLLSFKKYVFVATILKICNFNIIKKVLRGFRFRFSDWTECVQQTGEGRAGAGLTDDKLTCSLCDSDGRTFGSILQQSVNADLVLRVGLQVVETVSAGTSTQLRLLFLTVCRRNISVYSHCSNSWFWPSSSHLIHCDFSMKFITSSVSHIYSSFTLTSSFPATKYGTESPSLSFSCTEIFSLVIIYYYYLFSTCTQTSHVALLCAERRTRGGGPL